MIIICVELNLQNGLCTLGTLFGFRGFEVSRVFGNGVFLDNEAPNSKIVADFSNDTVDERGVLDGRNE